MKKNLVAIRHELNRELSCILGYWVANAQDHKHGGFHGKIDHFNRVITGRPKGAVLNARILWTFSAAFMQIKDKVYLEMTTRAFNYISNHFIDREHGGLIWDVNELGKPGNTKKQIYAQAFGIYGFVEYHKATGIEESLELAKRLFRYIEKYSFDAVNGGYLECLSKDWKPIVDMKLSEKDENQPKSLNTNLHVLEAYTSLFEVWKNDHLKTQLRLLIRNFLDQIIDEKNRHFNLFFANDWTVMSNMISFGHDIEAAWLPSEAAMVIEDQQLLEEVQQRAINVTDTVIEEGMGNDGSLYYEMDLRHREFDTDRHWWPQAECLVGLMNAFEVTGEERYLKKCFEVWKFIKNTMIDQEHGEWFWSVDSSGKPNEHEDKAGFWKGPYHNSRACMEMIRRIDGLLY